MSLSTQQKKKIIIKFGKNDVDSGNSEVQIALLTKRINQLQSHFSINKKDHSSRLGLLNMVAKRRKLLNYLKKKSFNNYIKLVKQLSLRK
ncbi:30S ribosomal protein S15 [Buchnera aphidicola (Thelaxes californica)]|uniref:Small ribosomal subunit protein uS15 n=1 Tax=Buchnera aphidicola (Thelaxes californica) TaxID=1315998 RepID=A0A4D6YBS1_9GAMM|nr:30S ribosomal protein S15 [Buchnera aphidicola]QCI26819.1 30S ribosomal protein S15 [Buchnera aphidicola (Thelaxes californica)]